ncbi:MAG: OmpA family protein [Deltaproteobacteria bacterium]|nr:OmpA family protein [Deltaproteobacteria bacterium]
MKRDLYAAKGCIVRRALVALSVAALATASAAFAVDGPFVGMEVGASVPTNSNYRAHAEAGVMGGLFGGYMFNDYLGLQANIDGTGQEPDNKPRRFYPRENQWTSHIGYTLGPKLVIPFGENMELYGLAEGGGFTGTSGSLRQTAPGFSAGGGLDYYLTDHVSVGAFGRWNRMYQAPRPTHLGQLVADQEGPADAEWAVGGITMKYRFNGPQAAPPPPPPPPVAQAAPPPPPPPAKKKIILRGVNFDFNKSDIRKDAAQILDEAASVLKEEGAVGVMVVGHTDSKGADAYNQKLSERRAKSVREYLVKKGISASRLTTKGLGETQPVATNDSDEGRAQNRRVELLVE